MASALCTEQQLRCSICQHVFTNPTSLPCGHNYCLDCIESYWDTRTSCECPICRKVFKPQPDLRVNWVLQNITEEFKRSLGHKPSPPTLHDRSKSDGVLGQDAASPSKLSLIGRQLSCREVQTSVLWDKAETRRTGTSRPRTRSEIPTEPPRNICRTDRRAVCMKSTETGPEIDCRKSESTKILDLLRETEREFEDMMETKKRKAEEIKALVNQCKRDKGNEIQTSAQFMAMIRRAVDTQESLLQVEMEQEQVEVERRSNTLLKEVQEEIDELHRKHKELKDLKDSMDPFYIIQESIRSLTAPKSTADWCRVKLQTDNHIGTARNSFATLADLCHRFENQLCAEDLSRIKKYAVDVTLDPATAAAWLLLSPDRKQVSLGGQQQRIHVPNDSRRFDSCPAVLGKQGFSSGRHYWIVQVGDKTDWEVGVARESINRSGLITVRPDCGYWAICRRKGGSIIACAGPHFTLRLQENPKRVGVFLDHEKGSVTFYDTEAKTHIHTYSGCSFTEPLYPYFNPCLHENGKNIAPLFICPVKP